MALPVLGSHACPGRQHTLLRRRSPAIAYRQYDRQDGGLARPHHRLRMQRPSRCRHSYVAASAAAPSTEALPAELKKIVDLFNMVPDPKLKYQQLLAYAKKLPPMPVELHTEENKVRGCVSQVWVKPELRDGKLYWQADSDSALTKGLAALLVQGLSGCSPEEVARLPPDWIVQMGLQQSLTPSRNNGFFNMYGLMHQQAVQLCNGEAAPHPAQDGAPEEAAGVSDGASAPGLEEMPALASSPARNGNGSSHAAPLAVNGKPVRSSMEQKLTEALQPQSLTIVDESDQHAGHAGSRMLASPSGETHFRVGIVSSAFSGLNTVKRHRLVYQILKEELAGPVHALSLDTKTLEEAGG